MIDDRRRTAIFMVILLALGGLLTWWAEGKATNAVNLAYAPYNARLQAAKFKPLNIIPDAFKVHKTERVGQVYPNASAVKGQTCGSNCLAWRTVQSVKLAGVLPLPWVGGAGLCLLLLGGLLAVGVFAPNPRKNPINYERQRIRLHRPGRDLPVIQGSYGLTRDDKARGRREYGSIALFGKSGRGKSRLLLWWLLTADWLNFVVVDLKGELFRRTSGHRAALGPVLRFDLTSMEGDALDPLDTDNETTARAVMESFLPTDEGGKGDYFNSLAQEIAMAYWEAARLTGQSAMPILVRAATSSNKAMLELASGLATSAPPEARNGLLRSFEAAFGLLWNDPEQGGERNSVVNSFKRGFAILKSPEVLSTLCRTTFNPADLVEGRATLYITAPSASPPYKAPVEHLLGGVMRAIRAYVMYERDNKQGEDIVVLADEAGNLKVPNFAETLTLGRSAGLNIAAFFQTLSQLNKYAEKGNWQELADAFHHWAFWSVDDPAAERFLREKAGKFDKPNPSRNPEERQRRPYVEAEVYDEVRPRWKQWQVLALLDFDRRYMVFGDAVDPYKRLSLQARRVRRLMQITPPELDLLPAIPPIRLVEEQRAALPVPSSLPKRQTLSPHVMQPQKLEETDDDETF